MKYFCSILLVSIVCAQTVYGRGFSGNLGTDVRYLPESPQFPSQTEGSGMELVGEVEYKARMLKSSLFEMEIFLRGGSSEGYRNHIDVREMFWLYRTDKVDVKVGVANEYWGVTESWNLVNPVNQTDLIEGIDEKEKLGQPQVSATLLRGWGALSVYWLPYFRERDYPDQSARFLMSPPVSEELAVFAEGEGGLRKDFAVRYSNFIGSFDVGLSLFRGYGRRPWLRKTHNEISLVPQYIVERQLSVDLQYTRDALLLKFEGILNDNKIESFESAVSGFEYTFFQVFESDIDVGILGEYLYSNKRRVSPDVFEDDIFVGLRVSANNAQSSSFLLGVISDRESGEFIVQAEGSTRIGQNWTVGIDITTFSNVNEFLDSYERDSLYELELRYHF